MRGKVELVQGKSIHVGDHVLGQFGEGWSVAPPCAIVSGCILKEDCPLLNQPCKYRGNMCKEGIVLDPDRVIEPMQFVEIEGDLRP